VVVLKLRAVQVRVSGFECVDCRVSFLLDAKLPYPTRQPPNPNPQPSTVDPEPKIQTPKPYTLDHTPNTQDPKPGDQRAAEALLLFFITLKPRVE